MSFPIIKGESIVQVGDKVRFDVSSSFLKNGETLTSLEVRPDGVTFYNVTSSKYLDWLYFSPATTTAVLRMTTSLGQFTANLTVNVLSAADDKLFSSDNDILQHESDVMRFLPKGYSSFNHVHRSAQSIILDSLMQRGIYNTQNVPLTKDNIYNILEVKHWSKYLVLQMIYSNVQNEVNDVFAQKATQYRELTERAAQRAFLTLDKDEDGIPDANIDLRVGRLVRR